MIIYLVSGITFQVSLAARNGSTRRESCAEIDSIIDDEEDDDGTLCCHGWHLDIDLFICVRMYMYVYIYIVILPFGTPTFTSDMSVDSRKVLDQTCWLRRAPVAGGLRLRKHLSHLVLVAGPHIALDQGSTTIDLEAEASTIRALPWFRYKTGVDL